MPSGFSPLMRKRRKPGSLPATSDSEKPTTDETAFLTALTSTVTHSEQEHPVLWKQGNLPDNHTADNFLQRLVLNASVRKRNYWQLVDDAQPVSLQLSIVVAMVEAYLHLHNKWAPAWSILAIALIVILAGQLLVRLAAGRQLGGSVARGARQSVLLVLGVHFLSPLYSTLTRSISGDTIVAASTWLLLAHLYLHDYHFGSGVSDRLVGSLSLAAGISASVLLASRLSDPRDVCAQVLFSLTAFIIFPFACRHIRILSARLYTSVVTTLAILTSALLGRVRWQWVAASLVCHGCLVFACPMCLLSIHKFKAQISGPWDEAVPRLAQTCSLETQRSLPRQFSMMRA